MDTSVRRVEAVYEEELSRAGVGGYRLAVRLLPSLALGGEHVLPELVS